MGVVAPTSITYFKEVLIIYMKKGIYIIAVFMSIALVFLSSCKKEDCDPGFNVGISYGTFTDDRDGYEYKTVKIGDQIWMAENLRYFEKGEKSIDCNVYGQLYGEYTVKNACPSGWHLPSQEEWMELADSLGGVQIAGGSLKESGTEHWQSPNTDATNISGFTALPAGAFDHNSGGYDRGKSTYFWSSTEIENGSIVFIQLKHDQEDIVFFENCICDRAFSIRCIKDK